MRNALSLFACFVLAIPLSAQERRAMTTDDALNMVSVGGATISPDVTWVLLSNSELDWEENDR